MIDDEFYDESDFNYFDFFCLNFVGYIYLDEIIFVFDSKIIIFIVEVYFR